MKRRIQWHPAFADALRLELKEYEDVLHIEEEHQLTSKPLEVDIIIIKKVREVELLKNIVKIFKGYNIIEYKSPDDYVSVDDYFKIKAYAYLYKVNGDKEDKIKLNDMTITIACSKYPRNLIHYFEDELGLKVINEEEGIYWVLGGELTTQIVVISRLSPKVNRFVTLLLNKIIEKEQITSIYEEYKNSPNDSRYEHLIDIVEEVEIKQIEEVEEMPRALTEKEISTIKKLADKCNLKSEWKTEGRKEGRKEGEARSLIRILTKKFGDLPKDIEENILSQNDSKVLDNLLDNIFSINTTDEIRGFLTD